MTTPIHVLGISGSLRRASWNTGLLHAAGDLLPEGMALEIADLADIPLYNQDHDGPHAPEAVKHFKARIRAADALLIFSVGGGDREKNVSANLTRAIDTAKAVGASVFGIVGRDGGYTGKNATACVVVPPLYNDRITPHTEGLAAVIWHLLVSHPALKVAATKWESVR